MAITSTTAAVSYTHLESVLGGWLGMEPKHYPLPPVGLRTEKVARPKNRKAIGWSARTAKAAVKSVQNKKPPAKG